MPDNLKLRAALIAGDGPHLTWQHAPDLRHYEVDGLPAGHYARIETITGSTWELKWSHPGSPLTRYGGMFYKPAAALDALRALLEELSEK